VSYSRVQNSTNVNGSASVTLALPAASTAGNLLIATVVSDGATAGSITGNFTAPTVASVTYGWQLAKSVGCPGGVLEIWYFCGNPGGLYGPGNGAVFTAPAGAVNTRGAISEYFSGAGTYQVLANVGQNSGATQGTSMPIASIGGTFAGSLGILSFAEFWPSNVGTNSANPPGNGYTFLVGPSGSVPISWNQWDNLNLVPSATPAAIPPAMTPGFTATTPTANGWTVAVCFFRAVTVRQINWCGGEVTNCLDIDPTGQMLLIGGDVEGPWISANYGDNWQPIGYGLENSNRQSSSFIQFSRMGGTEAGNIYYGGGHTAGDGAFLVSTDGGCSFTQRSTTNIWWYGNGTPSPPRPSSISQDRDRSVGTLLAQDATNGLMYSATGNLMVARTGDFGVTWATISSNIPGATNQTYWPRCIRLNPGNLQQLIVGGWDAGNGLGGVWYSSNCQATPGSVNWSQVPGYTGTVTDIVLVGGFAYFTADSNGLFRMPIGAGIGGASTQIMNSLIETSGQTLWMGIDGYVDTNGDHVLIIAGGDGIKHAGNANSTQVVRVRLPGGSLTGATFTDLTNSPTGQDNVTFHTFPPFSQVYWKDVPSNTWHNWLGNGYHNAHIRIDPTNTQNIYLTGSGASFRSRDGGATWQMTINGMPLIKMNALSIDPTNPSHFIAGGNDYTLWDYDNDPSVNSGANNLNPPGTSGSGSLESHCIDQDPVDGRLYLGLNAKYSSDTQGQMFYSPNPTPATTWSAELGYKAAAVGNGHAPMGIIAGRDSQNLRFFVVAACTVGLFRWSVNAAGAASWAKCTELDSAPLPGSGGTLGQRSPYVPFAQGINKAVLFCWDQPNGLYRSNDYGVSWTQIWTTLNGNQLAYNPAITGDLWAAGPNNLYHIQGADSGVVGQPGGPTVTSVGGPFAGGCGGVAFGPSGEIYAFAEAGGSGGAISILYVSHNNGTSWQPYCNGDGSDTSYGCPAAPVYCSTSGWLWTMGSNVRMGFYAQIAGLTGTANLSGQGTLTAVSSGSHGSAALSGTGTLTANGSTSQSAHLSGSGTLTANSSISSQIQGSAALNGTGTMTALPSLITSVSILPVYQPEQLILVSDANQWFTWDIAYKVLNTPRTTSTIAPDPDLSIGMQAQASYEVRTVIFYDGPTSADIQFNWAYPSDAVMTQVHWRWRSSAVNVGTQFGNKVEPADCSTTSQREVILAYGNIQCGVTQGSVSFQWAQNSQNNTPLNLLAGSFMMIRRLA
jgi:hypothetical protein